MAANEQSEDEPRIHAPDRSLHAKIGHADLDKILTAKVIEEAQAIITEFADLFLVESESNLKEIEEVYAVLAKTPNHAPGLLPKIVDAAFSLKSKTGFGGYDLVSALAQSLQLYVEKLDGKSLTAKDLSVAKWHVDSLKQLLNARVEGAGDAVGAAILAEVERLWSSPA